MSQDQVDQGDHYCMGQRAMRKVIPLHPVITITRTIDEAFLTYYFMHFDQFSSRI